MKEEVRSAQGHVDESVGGDSLKLLDGELVLSYGFADYHEGVFVDLGLFGSLPHFDFQFPQLTKMEVTSIIIGSFSDITLVILNIFKLL